MPDKQLFGWSPNPEAVNEVLSSLNYPLFGPAAFKLRDSGKGKTVLLYDYITKAIDEYNVRAQAIGDCVSFGAARAVDILRAIQTANAEGQWVAETCTEAIYALSRVEIGKGRLGRSDGSYGAWGAKAVKEYGTLVRKEYGEHDLTEYSGQKARSWGMPKAGLPDELEPPAREHLVRTISLVTTWEELRDSIASGYPVTIASDRGFNSTRDEDGFLKPRGSWPHQMCVIGVDDNGDRPGACIDNSWGPHWVDGPKKHGQPDGSFWCDAEVLENDILRQQDSWAFSEYIGFPPKKLDLRIV
jgi:hypothetical protein